MAVSRALVQVGVVAAQWSLAEGGDLTQPRQSQQSPAGANFSQSPAILQSSESLRIKTPM